MTTTELKVYSMVFTRYTDDYKSRGDDWSETFDPEVFATEAEAEESVKELIRQNYGDSETFRQIYYDHYAQDAKKRRVDEGDQSKDSEYESEESESEDYEEILFSKSLSDLQPLIDQLQSAEYVSQTFDWMITPHTIRIPK